MDAQSDTAQRILDVAQQLVQTRGYNAFSYADVSARVGIRNASVHYHFPNKSDLGRAVIARYRAAFRATLDRIDRGSDDPCRKLVQYVEIYRAVLRDTERICLCGMLAADFTTLPDPVRAEVRAFFADNEVWLAAGLTAGREARRMHFTGSAEAEAQVLVAGLEGAMLLARSYNDPGRFDAIARQLLARLGISP
jgi:TetR/AcrR family transcriptional repressor of nem operon